MEDLQWPFDSQKLLRNKKKLRRQLLEDGSKRIQNKIAILGGSTTEDIKNLLELFLLDNGIEPSFYESEYNQYWEDVMFDNSELMEFRPDIIYVHTTIRNIKTFPSILDNEESIKAMLDEIYNPLEQMWDRIKEVYQCPVIQNNFNKPYYRILGNREAFDIHGSVNFVSSLNERIYKYARLHNNFYINDIDWLSSSFGIQAWNDAFYWHMYKYSPALPAIPELAFNIANIIKSIYGKNKKAFALDLDNTLWGGIVGDDGPENIEIGQETSMGQLYSEFQSYIKTHKDFGVLLNVDSKNEEENALAGLERPDSILKPEDFLILKTNWNPKDMNLVEIAKEINIGTDAFVFVDDNPAERHIVKGQVPDVAVPEIGEPQDYITRIDRNGYFEMTSVSEDDFKRNDMYKANVERNKQLSSFENYEDYLLSLEMKAEIKPFSPIYMSRIAQLTNKSNQFNLTTLRCTQADVENYSQDDSYITLYGKLEDKFGDNGVVSVVFGHCNEKEFHIDLWLMSCRVLKRDMEYAMMDTLVSKCKERGMERIIGYYYPTKKNKMVKDFYDLQGFTKLDEDQEGNTKWELDISQEYVNKNRVIVVEG